MPELDKIILGRLVIALAIVFGLSIYPSGPSSSHVPAASVHSHLATLIIDDHWHSHIDEDEEAEAMPGGHEHKHDPADHSHETVHGLPALPAPSFVAPRSRIAIRSDQPIHGLTITLDRPPRPTDIA